jgi:hypothetical protein
VTRPRFLLPLALIAFLYGGVGVVSSWGTIAMLTTPHDELISAMRESHGSVFPFLAQVGTEDDQRRMAEREAEVLWARRNALIPLSVCNIIACTLILLGAMRSLRKNARTAWGCSAWQLGALLAIPCAVLDCLLSALCAREVLAAIAGATDPVSKQLREMALYLQSAGVKRWAVEGAATNVA